MWGEKHATLAAQQTPQNVTETNLSRESEMLECVINQNLLWEKQKKKKEDLNTEHNVASPVRSCKVENRPRCQEVCTVEMPFSLCSNDSCVKIKQKPSIYLLLTQSCLAFSIQKSTLEVWLLSNYSFATWHWAMQEGFSQWKKPEGPIQTHAFPYIKFKKSQGLCRKH